MPEPEVMDHFEMPEVPETAIATEPGDNPHTAPEEAISVPEATLSPEEENHEGHSLTAPQGLRGAPSHKGATSESGSAADFSHPSDTSKSLPCARPEGDHTQCGGRVVAACGVASDSPLAAPSFAAEHPEVAAATAEGVRLGEFAAFFRARPDVSPADIPDEVLHAVGRGEPLMSAYLLHENSLLRSRMEALEQEKKNAARSTGSADTAGRAASDAFDSLWYSD